MRVKSVKGNFKSKIMCIHEDRIYLDRKCGSFCYECKKGSWVCKSRNGILDDGDKGFLEKDILIVDYFL